MTARLTKARLKMMMDAAKENGGRVVMTREGDVAVEFGAPANEHNEDPDEAEARRIQEVMRTTMGSKKR
jgi:hypothetical protein